MTLEKYEALEEVHPEFDAFQGVRELSEETFPVLILILFLYFTAHTIFLQDESGETDRLERTAQYGRRTHMTAKLLAAVSLALLMAGVFSCSAFLHTLFCPVSGI